jgi:hypothetical protein
MTDTPHGRFPCYPSALDVVTSGGQTSGSALVRDHRFERRLIGIEATPLSINAPSAVDRLCRVDDISMFTVRSVK